MKRTFEGKEYDPPGCCIGLVRESQERETQEIRRVVCQSRYQCRWLGDCLWGVKKPKEVTTSDEITFRVK